MVIRSTKIDGLKIREATAADVPIILGFIRELAEFERLTHEVVATEEIMCRSLYGERRVAEVLIGFVNGVPRGFVLFFHNFSTFLGRPGIYIEDLYVQPAYRRMGIGRALLTSVARIARERQCGRVEWAVLDWNKRAIKFYEDLGAIPMSDWTVYRLTGRALERAAEEAQPPHTEEA